MQPLTKINIAAAYQNKHCNRLPISTLQPLTKINIATAYQNQHCNRVPKSTLHATAYQNQHCNRVLKRGAFTLVHGFIFQHPYIINFSYFFYVVKLLLQSGDMETNPGPDIWQPSCISLIHQTIRSVRNEMEYIRNINLDFDVTCVIHRRPQCRNR